MPAAKAPPADKAVTAKAATRKTSATRKTEAAPAAAAETAPKVATKAAAVKSPARSKAAGTPRATGKAKATKAATTKTVTTNSSVAKPATAKPATAPTTAAPEAAQARQSKAVAKPAAVAKPKAKAKPAAPAATPAAPATKTAPPVSPLAPKTTPVPGPVAGVRFSTAAAGIRYKGRTDVLLVALDEGTTVAGVFTRSKCPSAPVEWCRDQLAGGQARALVVNSGNANAFTGRKGREATALTAKLAAAAAGCKETEVFLASTGVIGEPLDATKYDGVLGDLVARLAPEPWIDAAKAIMTTDTFPKLVAETVEIDGVPVNIVGMAKGAGMIAPDMATMLSFIFTDAPIAAGALQHLLSKGVVDSFNAVTIDGDTSTSDTLLMFATGAAEGIREVKDPKAGRLKAFRKALKRVLADLAEQVARDGEGARKLVRITVEGAVSKASARRIALSIANSPLVKTAVAGEDANWGRVVMAVGKAGEPADRDRLAIRFGAIQVAAKGARDPSYDEAEVSAYMKGDVIDLTVDLGLGEGSDRVMTCDLTKEYVAINGDYRS